MTATADRIPLSTLQDILNVESDTDFEQILAEISGNLRALRALSKQPGHIGFDWPIQWRRTGPPSTITTHCPDGCVLPRPLNR